MSGLTADARADIEATCGAITAYARFVFVWPEWPDGDDTWPGDECGCPDDACIGYHHAADRPCGCLLTLLRDYTREKTAAGETWIPGDRALHVNGQLDSRGVAEVSPDGTMLRLQLVSTVTRWLPAAEYTRIPGGAR